MRACERDAALPRGSLLQNGRHGWQGIALAVSWCEWELGNISTPDSIEV